MTGISDEHHFVPVDDVLKPWACELGKFSPVPLWDSRNGILDTLIIFLTELLASQTLLSRFCQYTPQNEPVLSHWWPGSPMRQPSRRFQALC